MATRDEFVGASILSVALLTVMAGAAVSPVIGSIARDFPDADAFLVRLVVTLPPLFVIPSALFADRIARAVGKKTALLVGLVFYTVGGMAGGFAETIETMLVTRAVLGLAVGLLMPLSTALVTDYFSDQKAARMMGWISASNHLGGMVAQVAAGALAILSWRYAFGVYALGGVVFFIVLTCMPPPRPAAARTSARQKHLPGAAYLGALAMFGLMLAFYAVPVNLSLLIETNKMGTPLSSGAALALVTGAAFVMGLSFQRIQAALRFVSVVLATLIMASGFGVLSISGCLEAVLLGVCLVGIGQGYLLPYIFHAVRETVQPHQSVQAMALLSTTLYLGQFSSPLVVGYIGEHMCLKQEGPNNAQQNSTGIEAGIRNPGPGQKR